MRKKCSLNAKLFAFKQKCCKRRRSDFMAPWWLHAMGVIFPQNLWPVLLVFERPRDGRNVDFNFVCKFGVVQIGISAVIQERQKQLDRARFSISFLFGRLSFCV